MKWMRSVYDVILDRSTEELLGAILVCVALSIAVSGLFALLRRRAEDKVLLVIVLLLMVSIGSMSLGAGYIGSTRDRRPPMPPGGPGENYPGSLFGRRPGVSPRSIRRADTDADGRISRDEAAEFARSFIGGLDPTRPESAEIAAVAEAVGQVGEFVMAERAMSAVDQENRFADALASVADANRDGHLGLDELERFFRSADLDNNGELAPPELRSALRALTRILEGRGEGKRNLESFQIQGPAPFPPPDGPSSPPGRPFSADRPLSTGSTGTGSRSSAGAVPSRP